MANFVTRGIPTILRVIFNNVPNHTKRLILWTSLYSKICGEMKYSPQEAEQLGGRLNTVLDIAKDNKAFIFPVGVSRFIYKDLDECITAIFKAVRNSKTADKAALEFVQSVPEWLRYASESFILRDFRSLLSVHPRA